MPSRVLISEEIKVTYRMRIVPWVEYVFYDFFFPISTILFYTMEKVLCDILAQYNAEDLSVQSTGSLKYGYFC